MWYCAADVHLCFLHMLKAFSHILEDYKFSINANLLFGPPMNTDID